MIRKIPQIVAWIIHPLNMKFFPLLLCPRHNTQISLEMRAFVLVPLGWLTVVIHSYS